MAPRESVWGDSQATTTQDFSSIAAKVTELLEPFLCFSRSPGCGCHLECNWNIISRRKISNDYLLSFNETNSLVPFCGGLQCIITAQKYFPLILQYKTNLFYLHFTILWNTVYVFLNAPSLFLS